MKDLESAIDRLIAGLEKKRVMSSKEREIVAYHESGHAIVASVLPGLDPVHKISIVQRGFGALGYTMQLPLEDRYLLTRGDLLSQLAVLLGGRTAEEIALGEISTGAQNDLQRATDIARAMVTEFGMSDELGAINYDGNKRARFLDIPMPQERGTVRGESNGAEDRQRDQADPSSPSVRLTALPEPTITNTPNEEDPAEVGGQLLEEGKHSEVASQRCRTRIRAATHRDDALDSASRVLAGNAARLLLRDLQIVVVEADQRRS